MAVDAFLKIKGIEGDATQKFHKGEIEVLSYSWGIAQVGDPTTGGGTTKVSISDFSIQKFVDKASPLLFAACCTGEHFPDAIFTVEPAGAGGTKPTAFLKIKLSDVLISSFQASGSSETPTESVSISFREMEIQVRDETGKLTTATSCARPGGDV